MWSAIEAFWAFLQNEANQKALALIGGFILGVWTIVFGLYSYIHPPKKSEDEEEAGQGTRRSQSRRRRKPLVLWSWWWNVVANSRPFAIWIIGFFTASALFLGWYFYLNQPTITANFKVCRGEYEGSCGPHDAFVGCGDLNSWAINACIKFSSAVLSSRDGNRCGYTVVNYTCSQKIPR
jgi:hypothetical protein